MSAPLRLDLRLLGRFAVAVEGEAAPAIRLSSRKSRALLAYLAMQPTLAETRERLADLLWGNSEDKHARQSLRQCLALVRREVEPAGADLLVMEHDTVALAADRVAVDAREFLRLGESSEPRDLERAANLYLGPFLDDLHLDREPFSDWVQAERARFAAKAAEVFTMCARAADTVGQGVQAVKAAERLVALDPLHEPAQALLLSLLAKYHGREAALAQADTVEALLRRELGVDPEPETRALIEEIRSAARARPLVVSASQTSLPPNGRHCEPGAQAQGEAIQQPQRDNDWIASSARPRFRGDKPPRNDGAERPRRSQPARIWPHAALAAVAVAILAGVGAFLLAPSEQAPIPSQAAAPREAAAAPPWASPAVPGVTADQKWVGAQGMYAVLVLPFSNDSPESAVERLLAERLSNDLTGDLSRVPAIRVISRQTARLYRGRAVDPAAIGAELGVRYVVEGHVRLEDARATIDVALIDTGSRLQVWSERFTRDATDPSELQDDISRGLARRLQISLIGAEERRRLPQDASRAEIRDLLAKGWGAVVRMSAADRTGGAEGYFEEVLRRDPDNVSAMTGLAASHVQAATMFLLADAQPRLDRAEELLRRAIAASPQTSLAHFYLGMLEKNRANPQAALAAFTKVLELNPSYAPAYAQVGHVLSRTGRLNEAMEHVRYAIRLSPKDHAAGIWTLFGGQIELEFGHDDLALEWLSRAVELTPRSPFAQASLAAAYALRGDHGNAAKHAEAVRKLAPTLTLERMRERLVGLSEHGGEPSRLLEGLRLAFAKPS